MRINIQSKDAEKPKFRINLRSAEPESLGAPWSLWSEPFRKLVLDALEASNKVDAMQRPHATKLSCEAFLRQTLAISKAASMRRVHELHRKLESGDSGLECATSALRKMVKELKGPTLRTPPTPQRWEERYRALFLQPRVTEVQSELAAVDATPLELFGVAILIAGKTPGVFGTAGGTQVEIDADIATATRRRDELFALIGTKWTADDIDAGEYRQGVTSAAKFKGTPVEVAPTESAGRRLIQTLASGQRLIEALKNQRKQR